MRILTIVVRLLIGALLLFASIAYFAKIDMGPLPKMSPEMMKFNEGLGASTYLMPFVKALELLCGLAFISGRFVALANLVILPISINIVLVHAFMGPEQIAMGAVLFVGNLFLIYRYWNHYKTVVSAR
ncbi:MAG: DoxX family protein [Flavobacterium sp. BFFFF1]|uniref:DoxX family protein n=1 Tax=unclassified Flavobacterium TaxID=196869 RepID=UPI000BD8B79D|nr:MULTISPECIES: DoxX family protein [unclassified Flavobacterium]OYU80052.1 MAG: DoxX family protein [Flavobacterium sp. BFFFF1]